MTGRAVDIGHIVSMLGDRMPSLCAELLPAGTRGGGEWRVGSIAGEPGSSLMVHLSGAKAGVWCDFAAHSKGARDGQAGDALDLVAQVLFRGDKRQAVAWARRWLGIDHLPPEAMEYQRRQAAAKKRNAAKEDADKARAAFGIFIGAQKRIQGTPAERYLQARGIDFAALGRLPGALRFNPALADAETGCFWPTLVAGISDPSGRIVAVHRTFLEVHGDGRVTKAPLDEPKQSLGRYVGGCIRLWRGATGKSLHEAEPGEWCIVGEGIEDVATAVMEKPELRAVVGVSLSNMGSIILPPAIEGVILLGQNDPELNALGQPHPSRALFARAVAHFQKMGKRVKIARPPEGTKDLNELLTAGGNAA